MTTSPGPASSSPAGSRRGTGTPSSPSAAPSAAPSGSPSAALSPAEVLVLQRVLDGERAAGYGFGVVGGQASAADRPRALAALGEHAARARAVAQALTDAGADPRPEAPAYALPFAVVGPAAARRLAVHLEQGLAAGYADLVAAADPSRRAAAAARLTGATLAARAWGARPVPFPGLPERT